MGTMDSRVKSMEAVLATLTTKQRELLGLIAEGLTGEEIAAQLNISHSAVRQRIQKLRQKFGGIPKVALSRAYRDHVQAQAASDCTKETVTSLHLPDFVSDGQSGQQNQPHDEFVLNDSYVTEAFAPWSTRSNDRLVPEVLDGENSTFARWLYVIGAAVSLAVLLLVLLAVSSAVGELA